MGCSRRVLRRQHQRGAFRNPYEPHGGAITTPDENAADFSVRMDGRRLLLQDKGETFPDESFEDVILRSLSKDDYVRIR